MCKNKFLSKYYYYFCSVFTLLKGILDPVRTIKIFVQPDNTKEYKLVKLKNGLTFKVRSKMDIWTIKETILDCCYEDSFINFSNPKVVIDIGCAFGDFSIWMASRFPNSRILAFEPQPDSYQLAASNIQTNNLTNIELHNYAIGSKEQILQIALATDKARGSVTLINGQNESDNTVTKEIRFIPLQKAIENFDSIDLLKMDCEGGEYDIILNSPREVITKFKNIAMEWHNGLTDYNCQDLINKLSSYGFEVKMIPSPVHNDIGFMFAKNLH